ncbi:MAG: helix-turn-helix domain-containing protein [Bacteroidales bacterium]|jgi:transcriptional regulator with XRE-family HTH domain|nr:helix-turn-helix transcriptional regulator [Bacteroidales bacterium]MCR5362560.1 helix-turn-helix domain-containing protein [Bacteroidales bacterium]
MDYKDVLKGIGAKMKSIRLAQNMKQTELVEKTGLSLFTISQTETGHNTSLETIILMLNALGRMDLLDAFLKPEPIIVGTRIQKAVRRRIDEEEVRPATQIRVTSKKYYKSKDGVVNRQSDDNLDTDRDRFDM